MSGEHESVRSTVSTHRAGRADAVLSWPLGAEWGLSDDQRAAALAVTGERGRSGWVGVRCQGHDAGRHSRLRLEFDGDRLLLRFDVDGGIAREERQTIGGGLDVVEGVARLRLTCEQCGRSASRSQVALLDLVLRALLVHAAERRRGRSHVARVNWWASP